MKMLRVVFLMVCMLMVTVVGFCSPKEKADDIKDVRTYLAEVHEDSGNFKSMHLDIAIDLKNSFGSVSATSKIDLLNDPVILGKMYSEIAMAGSQNKVSINQYVSQVGDDFIAYSLFGDKWEKTTIPFKEMQTAPEIKEVMGYINYIKSVKIKEQTVQKIVLNVIVDMAKLRRSFETEMKNSIITTTGLNATDSQEVIKLMDETLAAMGNITYTVEIDKQSKQIVSTYSDLSNAAQKVAKFVLKKLPMSDQEKDVYQAFTNNISVTVKADVSQYNSVPKFTIPEDIVKNAKEVKVDEKVEQGMSIPEEIEIKL